jgi:hypothetical protein
VFSSGDPQVCWCFPGCNNDVPPVVRQNEIVSSHEVKSRANLSRPVVVAAQWVNQHEIMLGFEAVQESILT